MTPVDFLAHRLVLARRGNGSAYYQPFPGGGSPQWREGGKGGADDDPGEDTASMGSGAEVRRLGQLGGRTEECWTNANFHIGRFWGWWTSVWARSLMGFLQIQRQGPGLVVW